MIKTYLIKVKVNTDDTDYSNITEALYGINVDDVDLLEEYED